MSDNLYITATEARSGKSAISLGVMEMISRRIDRVGFFRPLVGADPAKGEQDNDITLIANHFHIKADYELMYGYTAAEARQLFASGREADLLDGILKKYNLLQDMYDFVLCEGTDYLGSSAAFEFDINAAIAKNLGCPVLVVVKAKQKTPEESLRSAELTLENLEEHGCEILGTIVNRVSPKDKDLIVGALVERDLTKVQQIYAIPEEPTLGLPTVAEIARALDARVLYGEDQLNRHVYGFSIAAMQLRNYLERIEHGSLVIVPGDRADVIVASLAAVSSMSMANISGLVLTGGLLPEEPIVKLIEGFKRIIPILSVEENTYPTATRVDRVHSVIAPDNYRKITRALAHFDKHVDEDALSHRIITIQTSTVTPKMFEYQVLQKARANRRHIVLAEGWEDRILKAAETLLRREVVDLTLLGEERRIREKIVSLGLQLNNVRIVDPLRSEWFDDFVETYHRLRRHKGITPERARDVMGDVNYFGTMMIHKGLADGMVSGSVHTTGATILPAFEIIKTKPGVSIVSSVFFMCLEDRVLVYGDCAINPNPTAEQLSEIALSSAQTARTFGIDPVVAMLSYSTGESGHGEDVERVREATRLAQEKAASIMPGLPVEGPLQYDAAVDLAVARTKMPESQVAGRATVFIFPDLNTGNNTYKAVQRSSGAVAVGPVLQGLNHPVNDLSRGCTVPDIVNTVAITAIQAQAEDPAS